MFFKVETGSYFLRAIAAIKNAIPSLNRKLKLVLGVARQNVAMLEIPPYNRRRHQPPNLVLNLRR